MRSFLLQRKVDLVVEFISEEPVVRKSFQVNNQNVGQSPQIKLLHRLLQILTFGTIPKCNRSNYTVNLSNLEI